MRHNALSPKETAILNRFEAGLDDVQPYLFGMTDALMADYPERKWNLLVGDDTSARLVVRFVRLAFLYAGHSVPTRYIAASSSVNQGKPRGTYDRYAQRLVQNAEEPRALLVTEAAGETLGSVRFAHALLNPHCVSLDTAIVASRGVPSTDDLGRVYCGAVRDERAMNAVWRAFENPTDAPAEQAWSGALNNLDRNSNSWQGHAKGTSQTAYRRLARHCYLRMNDLAKAYQATRSSNERALCNCLLGQSA